MPKFVVCCDTFKGSLSAARACAAIRLGILDAFAITSSGDGDDVSTSVADVAVTCCPMSDGGLGLLAALEAASTAHGSRIAFHRHVLSRCVLGPLGEPLDAASFATVRLRGSEFDGPGAAVGGETLYVVEMAEAAGLPLVPPGPLRDPRRTTSFGVGTLVAAAADAAIADSSSSSSSRLLIGIGGSATNDAGLGALQALGLRVLVSREAEIEIGSGEVETAPMTGGALARVVAIEGVAEVRARVRRAFSDVTLICDVDNPLVGPRGATFVYGPQKGAAISDSGGALEELEAGMVNAARRICEATGVDLRDMAGAGGAGGMSGGFHAVLGATWRRGADVVAELVGLDALVDECDVVVTGEGSFDAQTLSHRKTVAAVLELAAAKGKSAVVICGCLDAAGAAAGAELGAAQLRVAALVPRFPLGEALEHPERCLRAVARELFAPE